MVDKETFETASSESSDSPMEDHAATWQVINDDGDAMSLASASVKSEFSFSSEEFDLESAEDFVSLSKPFDMQLLRVTISVLS
jgi:hypothetical protein